MMNISVVLNEKINFLTYFVFQEMVDEANTFYTVLKRAVSWLQEKELGTKYKYTFLTDG